MSAVSKIYNTDGSSKIFSSDFKIISESHVAVYLNALEVSKSSYDVINNSIVFETAPVAGKVLEVKVGTTPDDVVTPTTDIVKVANIDDDITTVAGVSDDVTTVASRITHVSDVARNIDAVVNAARVDADDVATIANMATTLSTVADGISSINTTSSNITHVSRVSTNMTSVTTASDAVDDIVTTANSISDVSTVAGDITNVSTVAGDITNVNTVANNIDTITTNSANIATVATDIDNVNSVANSIDNVNTVANNIATIDTNSANIATVATDITNINSVATEVAPNVTAILAVETNASASATAAATSATAAATSETNASASATAAATSETNAATSATSSSTFASNSATSATASANSATASAASASNASTSETNAATSEANAAASETNAAASAAAAAQSAIDAAIFDPSSYYTKTEVDTALDSIDTDATLATLNKSFIANEEYDITLSKATTAPSVTVTKEVPQLGLTNNSWDVTGSNYEFEDFALGTTLTPSAVGSGTFTLGVGSFTADNVGMRIVGNGGEAILTATDGSYESVVPFNDTSTIASGDWSMYGLDSSVNGVELSGVKPLYSIESSTYESDFLLTGQTGTLPRNVQFNSDGTKAFVNCATNDAIYQYSLSTPYTLSTISYDSISFSLSAQTTIPNGFVFSEDGSFFYILNEANSTVYQYSMPTPYDINNAVYTSKNASVLTNAKYPEGIAFSNDGSKMFISNLGNVNICEYNLSTAWDVSTASYSAVFASTYNNNFNMAFNNDGKVLFIANLGSKILKYNLSTAWDITTATDSLSHLDVSSVDKAMSGIAFSGDGSKMFTVGYVNDKMYEYSTNFVAFETQVSANQHLPAISPKINTTFWTDLNSMTATETLNNQTVNYAVSTDNRTTWSVAKTGEGVRNIVRNNGGTWEYNSDETYANTLWTPATTNNEFQALSEAMSVSPNQMSSTQLEAIQDSEHFTLGDTLDLAMILHTDNSTETPIADGVSINYDANVKNKYAILGTDYEAEQPANDVVRIKSLANNNLKVRIV